MNLCNLNANWVKAIHDCIQRPPQRYRPTLAGNPAGNHAHMQDLSDAVSGHFNILYGCEIRIITAELEKRINAFKRRFFSGEF